MPSYYTSPQELSTTDWGCIKIGARLNFTPGLFGIVTALAADSPEISSAVIALLGGHHDLSLGVVFGSNMFNLAALLGLSAVVSSRVAISHSRLLLNGIAGLLILGTVIGLLLGFLTPQMTVVLALLVFIPYTIVMSLRLVQIECLFLPGWLRDFLSDGLTPADESRDHQEQSSSGWKMLVVVPALFMIIFASHGLVNSAVSLADTWKVNHHIVGFLVLATLTGIPNVIAALQLAVKKRGRAVVIETLNSNTFNLFAGVCLPAIILGLGQPSQLTIYASWWLVGMTIMAIALAGFHQHLNRLGGVCLIAVYLVFAVFVFLQP